MLNSAITIITVIFKLRKSFTKGNITEIDVPVFMQCAHTHRIMQNTKPALRRLHII
jgi:hypothetical protein